MHYSESSTGLLEQTDSTNFSVDGGSRDQPFVHLLYGNALDLRLCLILSKIDFGVKPVSDLTRLFEICSARSQVVVIVDVGSELDSGIETIEKLAVRLEYAAIVPVSTNGSIDFVRRCFKAGVVDVLDKSFDDLAIDSALRALRESRFPQHSSFSTAHRRAIRFSALTKRERQVLCHLLEGLTSREISTLLGLSSRTVEVHRSNVLEKLCVRNVAQLAYEYRNVIAHCRPKPSSPVIGVSYSR